MDAPRALIAAANDLVDRGHPAAALPLAPRAVFISTNSPAAHEALGNALLGLGQAYPAWKEYNRPPAGGKNTRRPFRKFPG